MSVKFELREGECIVERLLDYCNHHPCAACGKCTFGYEGITQMQMILSDMTRKKGEPGDLTLLEDLCGFLQTESLCEDGEELSDTVRYCLATYRDELQQHADRKDCPAGVCRAFKTFHVLASKCNGCGDCEGICPDDAILGRKGQIHVVDLSLCTQCGDCLDHCGSGAIVMAGVQKPKGPKQPVPVRR